jgi:hypothetical protein
LELQTFFIKEENDEEEEEKTTNKQIICYDWNVCHFSFDFFSKLSELL